MRVKLAFTWRARLRGLSGAGEDESVLLLAPCNDIHTFTMHREIDVAFALQSGVIVESHRNVAPRRRLRNRRALVTLERFSCEEPWYEPGDVLELVRPSGSLESMPSWEVHVREKGSES